MRCIGELINYLTTHKIMSLPIHCLNSKIAIIIESLMTTAAVLQVESDLHCCENYTERDSAVCVVCVV